MTATSLAGLDLQSLTTVVTDLAADPARWLPAVRFDLHDRYYTRLHSDDRVDVWLLTWLGNQATDLHDHGDSAACFAVVLGEVLEVRAGARGRLDHHVRRPGEAIPVSRGAVHDVRHAGGPAAVSIHAYSPPLTHMTFYRAVPGRLTKIRTATTADDGFEESL